VSLTGSGQALRIPSLQPFEVFLLLKGVPGSNLTSIGDLLTGVCRSTKGPKHILERNHGWIIDEATGLDLEDGDWDTFGVRFAAQTGPSKEVVGDHEAFGVTIATYYSGDKVRTHAFHGPLRPSSVELSDTFVRPLGLGTMESIVRADLDISIRVQASAMPYHDSCHARSVKAP
jgi:hypothetical protein